MIKDEISRWKRSKEVQTIVSKYSKISLTRQVLAVFINWFLIGSTIFFVSHFESLWIYLVSIVVIASRQQALLVIVHESAHFRLSPKRKLNDFVGNFFAAYPILFSTGYYRTHHSKHHIHLNSELDPDWSRKIGSDDWVFPKRKSVFFRMLGKQVLVGGLEWILLCLRISQQDRNQSLIATFENLMFRTMYYGFATTAVVYFGMEAITIKYWLIPLLTVFPLLQRLRSIAEHFGLQNSNELNSSRNVVAGPVEKFLLSPHSVNFHLVHHLFPSIPFFNLEKVHSDFMKFEIYRDYAHCNRAYFFSKTGSVFSDLTVNSKIDSFQNLRAS